MLGTVTVLRDATRDQELDRLKSEFLTVVSHELQTPLTAIKGALELVLDDDSGQLSRVQRRFLETIERNSTRLVGLVGDLLDLSRLEAGRVELEPQPLDTPQPGPRRSGGGQQPVRGARHRAARGRARVGAADPRRPAAGRADPDQPAGQRGQVHAQRRGASKSPPASVNGHVSLSVADNGPGVPESERDIVFDKFYRGRDAQQRGEAGSGLGLAIVKSLVDLHGGSGARRGQRAARRAVRGRIAARERETRNA